MSIKLETLWTKKIEVEESNFLAENTMIEIMPFVKTTMPDGINLLSVRKII